MKKKKTDVFVSLIVSSISCLHLQVLFAAVLPGDVLISPIFDGVSRETKLIPSIYRIFYMKEYIINFTNTPHLWTVSKFET